MKTINEIISEYSDINKTGFSFIDISEEFSKVSEEEKRLPEFNYETVAVSLVDNSRNEHWGTYYGPYLQLKDKDNNNIDVPPYESITVETITYWEKRIPQTENPLLKSRYCGLVWEFKFKVCNERHSSSLQQEYIKALLDAANGNYCKHPISIVVILERAFHIASKDKDYKDVKKAYSVFEKNYATDEFPAYWASQFRLMLNYPKRFSETEKNTLLSQHEERLKRLSATVNAEWVALDQATLLADYYIKSQNLNEINRVLLIAENAFRNNFSSYSAMQQLGVLDDLAHKYAHYSLSKERERLITEISAIGNKAKNEMNQFEVPTQYSQEALNEVTEDILKGDESEQIKRFVSFFIPHIEYNAKQLREYSQKFPLQYLTGTQIIDDAGRPLSYVGNIDDDFDGQLIQHITQNIEFESPILRYVIAQMIGRNILSTASIRNQFEKSGIFDENKLNFIINCFENYYFKCDPIAFCHLIVPQIEDTIRAIVELSGHSVIRPQRNNKGYQLKTLDDLLRDESISRVYGDDVCLYLRIYLTDQRGENIRNSLCHGTRKPGMYDLLVADRLLHIMFLLSQVRVKKIQL